MPIPVGISILMRDAVAVWSRVHYYQAPDHMHIPAEITSILAHSSSHVSLILHLNPFKKLTIS